MLDPIVNHIAADSKLFGYLANREFIGALKIWFEDVMLVSNPTDDAGGEDATFSAFDVLKIEGGSDLRIGMFPGHRPDSFDDFLRIAYLISAIRRNDDWNVFHGASLPSDMQDKLLGDGKFLYGDVFYEQAQNTLAVFCLGGGGLPKPRQVMGQGSEFSFLLFGNRNPLLILVLGKRLFDLFKLGQGLIPVPLQSSCHQAIGGIDLLVAALGKLRFILCPFDLHPPLRVNGTLSPLQFLHSLDGDLNLFGLNDLKHAPYDRFVCEITAKMQTRMRGQGLAAAPVAFICGIETTVSLVANGNASATMGTEKQPLKKGQAFSGRSANQRFVCVGAVTLKKLLVLHELFPRNIAFMMILDQNGPIGDGHFFDPGTEYAVRSDLLDGLISAMDIGAGIDGIVEHPKNTAPGKTAPNQPAIPDTSIGALGKLKPGFGKMVHHPVCTARLVERIEKEAHNMLDLAIRIKNNAAPFIVNKTHRQGKSELPFLSLVPFSSLEAGAQEMQLCLGHGPLEPQQELVVEIGRVVNPVLVNDHRVGESTKLQESMPIGRGTGEPGGFQGKDRPDFAHGDVGHQALKIRSAVHLCSGNPQIAIQDTYPLGRPSQSHRFVSECILPLGALLVMAHLGHGGLPDVDISRFFQMRCLDFGYHDLPPRLPMGSECFSAPLRAYWQREWRSLRH
ncbi:conserved hypothetical protein [delta proteobacterium NaphS2]|nr:conserved hypothetical protein [delta proteobacterium NaphS2]